MIILDTHVLIWALYDPQMLSSKAMDAITNYPCCVSIASFWEMSIKISKGNLKLRESITELAKICESKDIPIINISPVHCEKLQFLSKYHSDPFDRIIISQAWVEGYKLVTADSNIWKGYNEVEKIW